MKNMIDLMKHSSCFSKKPLEIYVFIDPLCPECWALEPVLKKLRLEYGVYFRLRHVLIGKLSNLNDIPKKREAVADYWEKTASRTGMSCDGSLWIENPITSPYIVSIAIKAAELQGKKQGLRFLRKVQELVFLEKRNISDIQILVDCAKGASLDVDEFLQDIHSESAAKAFQCDLKITSEMEVTESPSLVFFNEHIEDEGLKISGLYSYDIYVQVLQEMLGKDPSPLPLPPLEEFLKYFGFVASKEIAVVYDMPVHEAEKELKKLVLQQKVRKIEGKHGSFWKYIN
ncbi:ClpXP adapter SpxH family protein [Heyndrickxia coagulans]|uniref:ClpXP adapter protein SpxH n=1 Tax=Heyndrickxia coagulans DSM 1 = ATCC 7050 TaxID=1121088 RepID=A0A8B4BS05_HEYCO|nr:ClpXP adapter SpxH family protein [Heyndrickxia coagulans]AJH79973.1 DSBA-like thioredoxin domain protein [Heyndrickxia coagulans DSM 1 = ATCC 7050]MDR4223599.1 DsbA family protein [Heyndrickxia coagulans DSM 1 = ATCC 7050]MED4493797.1 ClpXP adapter SpxH family protein [Heyndrickxia coagulans]MED4537141.1 ClpXP adapter SpxH family protein [Heyndrickxia coagulans]QJE31251.1 DsbA family protein [Heyndrickxia coagulans]